MSFNIVENETKPRDEVSEIEFKTDEVIEEIITEIISEEAEESSTENEEEDAREVLRTFYQTFNSLINTTKKHLPNNLPDVYNLKLKVLKSFKKSKKITTSILDFLIKKRDN